MERTGMLLEMLELQLIADRGAHAKGNTNYETILDKNQLWHALFDELGEVNHEIKGLWSWWKLSQKAPDQQKVLEELSDVTHFVLSNMLAAYDGNLSLLKAEIEGAEDSLFEDETYSLEAVPYIISFMLDIADMSSHYKHEIVDEDCGLVMEAPLLVFNYFTRLVLALGYDFESDIYPAYVAKNKVNLERNASDY